MTARLLINLAALVENYERLSTRVPCAAVVKADAYGCGAIPVAQALFQHGGARHFFVATCAEALSLRQALPAAIIYVLEGPRIDTAAVLADAGVVPVVNHVQQLAHWQPHRHLPVAVQVDTGMARLGFEPDELRPERFTQFSLCLLMTHLACADEPAAAFNGEQLRLFAQLRLRFPEVPVSVGSSAAVLSDALSDVDLGLARPGIALYGGAAFAQAGGALRPVAALQGQVLQLRTVQKDQPVGYGGSWRAQRHSTLAVVGVGYADGLRRALSNRGVAVLAGQRVPIVGRVSMDMVHLDVTGLPVRLGDWAEFFGEQLPIAEMARLLETIDYEILTSIGARVRREYHGF